MAPDTEVAFIPMEAIGEKGELDTSRTKPLSEVISGYSYVADGDIMIAKITPCFENGKGAIARNLANGIGFATTEVINIRPNNPNDAVYLHYLLSTDPFRKLAEGAMYGAGGQKRVADSFVAEYHLSLPALTERTRIAAFLDHETAKIDALIEKQQRLIELLKEKRQAVISHAVTKGLNPNAPMKDSGVEWLGEVPAHWITKRLKHISPKIGVGLVINPSTYTRDEGVYFIFGGDVKEYGFDLSNTRRMSPQDSNSLLPSRLNHRDLVCVRVGYPGITAVVTEALTGSNCASVVVIRRGEFNSDWLCAAMNTWIGRQQVELCSYGAAQKQFNVSDAIDFVFPAPPPHEQDALADYVSKELARFNVLISKAEEQISLLQERRTALISAAVTGKIDVRDWQAAAAQETVGVEC
jgi:type I restriction enzyme S subunit